MKQIKQFSSNDRFLSVLIYHFPLGDCTNGGASSGQKYIYIPCETGPYQFSEIDPKLIFIPEQRGPEYWAVKPLLQPEGMVGPMSGGNIAYDSDSRCKHVYHIHDRFESDETYQALSR